MDNYIQYTYIDEVGKNVAIVYKNIPKKIMEEYQKKYNEVKFEENVYERKLDC